MFTRGQGGPWRAGNTSLLFSVVAPVSQAERPQHRRHAGLTSVGRVIPGGEAWALSAETAVGAGACLGTPTRRVCWGAGWGRAAIPEMRLGQ